jgi:hypothetical protein
LGSLRAVVAFGFFPVLAGGGSCDGSCLAVITGAGCCNTGGSVGLDVIGWYAPFSITRAAFSELGGTGFPAGVTTIGWIGSVLGARVVETGV